MVTSHTPSGHDSSTDAETNSGSENEHVVVRETNADDVWRHHHPNRKAKIPTHVWEAIRTLDENNVKTCLAHEPTMGGTMYNRHDEDGMIHVCQTQHSTSEYLKFTSLEVAEEAVAILQTTGFDVNWDGEFGTAIQINDNENN